MSVYSLAPASLRRRLTPRLFMGAAWASLLVQVGLVASIEVADDLLRGMVAEHDSSTGVANALQVARFEADHHFWVEPGWQLFFEQTHHLLGLQLDWARSMWLFNTTYIFGHIAVTLGFALWLYFWRPALFGFVRNIFIGANLLALVGYESYPMAPPRLTSGLRWDGRGFHFVDTLYQVLGSDGKVSGTRLGYNEFAAMPSVHMAWALIVGCTLFCTLRHPLARALALCYPVLMLTAVVVTGNHYISDALGALATLVPATVLALGVRWFGQRDRSLGRVLRDLAGQRPPEPGAVPASGFPLAVRPRRAGLVRRPLAGPAAWPARWAVHLHIGRQLPRRQHRGAPSSSRWRTGRRALQHGLAMHAGQLGRVTRRGATQAAALGHSAGSGLLRASERAGLVAPVSCTRAPPGSRGIPA